MKSNSTSLLKLLSEITKTVLSKINIENYFELSQDKKMNLLFTILKLIKNSVNSRANVNDEQFKFLLKAMRFKNEENENYEIASILLDLYEKYDNLMDLIKTKTQPQKTKVDKEKDGKGVDR